MASTNHAYPRLVRVATGIVRLSDGTPHSMGLKALCGRIVSGEAYALTEHWRCEHTHGSIDDAMACATRELQRAAANEV